MSGRMDPRERAPSGDSPDRREFLALGVGLLLVSAVPTLQGSRRKVHRRSIPVMGTVGEVAVVHSDARVAQRAIDEAFRELQWVDETMSRFRPESDIGRANRLAAAEAVPIDPATAEVLRAGLRWADGSDGLFDPALGRVAELWDVGGRNALRPDAIFGRFAGAELHRQVVLSSSAAGPRVRFRTDDVRLDFGGIAKGYGVDRAARRLRASGIEDALVNVGGDLYALGTRLDGEPWRIGVRDPDDAAGVITTLAATDQAIATSGDYVRAFTHGGRRYHHILDAHTGGPVESPRRSLTVTASTCMDADAAATAAFGQRAGDASGLVRIAGRGARVLHSI